MSVSLILKNFTVEVFMIYVTGDTHGAKDFYKLLSPSLSGLTKNDYVIICGDIGVLFNPLEAAHYINLYSYLPFTVLFVDGNHENFDLLNSFPIQEWNGGKIHKISSSVFHLMRGQVFEIEEKKFFTFGGALSFDKSRRLENISWWKDEMPTAADYSEAVKNLSRHDNTVDYIISHDCPASYMTDVAKYSEKLKHEGIIVSDSNMYLQEILKVVLFKRWFFAHYHIDQQFKRRIECVFKNLILLK